MRQGEPVERKKYFGATLGWHWMRTGLFLLLFAEYMRLVLTTDAPSYPVAITALLAYRVVFTALLGLVFTFYLITLIRAHRQKAQDKD